MPKEPQYPPTNLVEIDNPLRSSVKAACWASLLAAVVIPIWWVTQSPAGNSLGTSWLQRARGLTNLWNRPSASPTTSPAIPLAYPYPRPFPARRLTPTVLPEIDVWSDHAGGGFKVVPHLQDLGAIPTNYLMEGRMVMIEDTHQIYRLKADLKTWYKL